MKKIPDDIDNPIDNYIIKIFDDYFCDFFKKTGHTPNMLTTYSLITGLLSCYFLNIKQLSLFAIFYSISYFFDCADGHFARKYNMSSKFGDYYDHIKDVSVAALIVVITLKNSRRNITPPIIALIIVMTFLAAFHLSCQENNCDKFKDDNNHFFKPLKVLCTEKENIKWSRFFGTGSFNIFFILIICFINRN